MLFAAVRAWRSSQAFPVKRRGPSFALVAGCRVLREPLPGRRLAALGGRGQNLAVSLTREHPCFSAGTRRGDETKLRRSWKWSRLDTPEGRASMRWRRSSSCVPFCDELAELGGQMEGQPDACGRTVQQGNRLPTGAAAERAAFWPDVKPVHSHKRLQPVLPSHGCKRLLIRAILKASPSMLSF